MTEAIERAKAEEAAGRAWRAKEILGGNVRQASFDAQLYREYGELLLRLGDQMEAGKYLLLAGSTDPEHQPAINLCVGRHAGSPSLSLIHI